MRTIDFRFAPQWRWTAICRPDDSNKTLVREDGALMYHFRSPERIWRFERIFQFNLFTDRTPISITQELEDPKIPVVITRTTYPKATLITQTFGHETASGLRADVVLWKIEPNQDSRGFVTALWLTVKQQGVVFSLNTPPSGAQTLYLAQTPATSSEAMLTGASQALISFISSPHPLTPHFAPGFSDEPSFRSPLGFAEEGLEGCLIIPLTEQDDFTELTYDWAHQALADNRHFWQGYRLNTLALDIPDDRVKTLLTASARNIMQAREIKDGLAEFQVGATCYRGLWIVDGHFMLEAVRYLGLTADADRGIDAVLRRVREDGSIVQYPAHSKETSISLATLVRQTELSNNWERLRELWPVVRGAVAHIQTLRAEARALPPSHPERGLLPASFGDGGLGGKRAEFTTTLWTLFGLKEAARAASILNLDDDAAAFQSEFDSLMADFRDHAQREMRTSPEGYRFLPMWRPYDDAHVMQPGYEGTPPPWHHLVPQSATWALCHSIYPGEVFAPDDPLVQDLCALFESIDVQQGIPANTGWQPYQAVWTYAASFAAHVWLYAGRPEKAVDYLYAFANHAAPTFVWREEQSFSESHHGLFTGDMPHNWASAEFIRLVRNLLVFESIEHLRLFMGLPQEWIVADRSIHIEKTPTRFGPITVKLTPFANGDGEIVVERDLSWPLQPKQVRMYLPPNVSLKKQMPIEYGYSILPEETRIVLSFSWR